MTEAYVLGFRVLSWSHALVAVLLIAASLSVLNRGRSTGTWATLLVVGSIGSAIGSLGYAVMDALGAAPFINLLLTFVELTGGVLILAAFATLEIPRNAPHG